MGCSTKSAIIVLVALLALAQVRATIIPVKVEDVVEKVPSHSILPGTVLPIEIRVPRYLFNPSDVKDTLQWGWRYRNVQSPLKLQHHDEFLVYKGEFKAPMAEGSHSIKWNIPGRISMFDNLEQMAFHLGEGAQKRVIRSQSLNLEVTCSNDVFCDGIERLVNGQCVSGPDPCDDGAECTIDSCSEEQGGRCSYELQGDCATCVEGTCQSVCVAEDKECGDDGCNGICGVCQQGFACVTGKCVSADQFTGDGTCSAPLQALPQGADFFGLHTIEGDTTNGVNILVPACNYLSGAAELIYQLDVPATGDFQFVGAEIRYWGYDTVMQLYEGVCGDPAHVVGCSDDATPPGNLGSRIETKLKKGTTYYIMLDGYNIISTGPFTMTIKLVADCQPSCDGSFCTEDGCGMTCGTCEDGTKCFEDTGRCLPDPCIPDCDGKECGDDGCFGDCGTCGADSICLTDVTEDYEIYYTGQCSEPFSLCDNFNPTCEGGCGDQEFCGSDCECHELGAAAPDLRLEVDQMKDAYIDVRNVPATSCGVREGCIDKEGMRALLRFTVTSTNQGTADFNPPDPKVRPDLYRYGQCHQHYHLLNYTNYALYDSNSKKVVEGRKEAYCMEDSSQSIQGPNVQCHPQFDCGAQGIQRGWVDTYGASLDCQWLDVTDVRPGKYRLFVELNPGRKYFEATFDNNGGQIYVTIPDLSVELGRPADYWSRQDSSSQSGGSSGDSSSSGASVLSASFGLLALAIIAMMM